MEMHVKKWKYFQQLLRSHKQAKHVSGMFFVMAFVIVVPLVLFIYKFYAEVQVEKLLTSRKHIQHKRIYLARFNLHEALGVAK